MQTIVIIFVILAICYVGLSIYVWLASDSMIFYPHRAGYPNDQPVIKLRTADGAAIYALYLRNDTAHYTILYSYGNGMDIEHCYWYLQNLAKAGFSVFAYDYHGYGASQGRPSEKTVYLDIDAAYDYLTDSLKIPPDQIIAHGLSLGGAIACDLASRRPLAGLIIESSFVSAYRVLTRIPLLLFDKFISIDKIRRVACPVLVLHGDKDRTINVWHARALYAATRQPKTIVLFPGGDHGDLCAVGGDQYYQAIQAFAWSLPSAQK